MGGEGVLYVTEAEAWTIEDVIRHTWTEEGRPVGKNLLLKIFAVIKEFEARRQRGDPPAALPIVVTEDECWAIDYHVRRTHTDPYGFRVGRDLLLKVFDLLLRMRTEEELRALRLPEAPVDEPDLRQRLDQLRGFFAAEEPPESEDDASRH